jgi:O-antigen ligase
LATLATTVNNGVERKSGPSSLAYNALLLFTFLYYTRPEDLIPTFGFIPLEKIIGGVAFIALVVTLASGTVKRKFPLELKLLLLLFCHFAISIPFAYWRGGAFATVFQRFYKDVTVGFLVTLVVDNFDQLRRLLWVQAASLVTTTIASIVIHRTDAGRLIGALGGVFENPNDLAINIAINWPLCLAFVLLARGMGKRAIWLVGILSMLLAVVLTYSRSGLIATVAAIMICLWKFGVRGKRTYLIGAAFVLAVAALGVVFVTPHYLARVESIFKGDIQGSADHGSLEARRQVLMMSVSEAVHHPIFGIGAGNFGAATKTWRVTHNTYMELAAEGGFPALFMFLGIIYLGFRNLKRVESSPAFRENADVRVLTDAMWASLAAFVIGALFASYEYELFPYFMMAYTSVLYRWCAETPAQSAVRETVLPRRHHWMTLHEPRESWKR